VTGPFILAQAKMGYDSHTGYFLPTEAARKDVPRRPYHRYQRPGAIEASGRLAGLKAAAAAGADMDDGHRRSRKGRIGPARTGARLQAGYRPGQGAQELHLLRRRCHR
jgi:hypothetical protein